MNLQPLMPADRAKILALFRKTHPACPLLEPKVIPDATGARVTVKCPCGYDTSFRPFELEGL